MQLKIKEFDLNTTAGDHQLLMTAVILLLVVVLVVLIFKFSRPTLLQGMINFFRNVISTHTGSRGDEPEAR